VFTVNDGGIDIQIAVFSTRELRLPLRTSLGGKLMERAKMQAVETLLSENEEPWR
jgi:hypothetical protein